jgi:very-short-patch-repair endonuclease
MDTSDIRFLIKEYPPKRKTSNVRIKYPKEYSKLLEVTSFLSPTATTSQRIWHLRNNIFYPPTCIRNSCNNITKWFSSYGDYAEYCSKKCYNKIKQETSEINQHKHNLKKYGEGYENLSSREKAKITNLERYGVDNLFKDVERIKKSNLDKYGVEYHFQQHLNGHTLNRLTDKDWLIEKNHVEGKSCVEIADILGTNNTTVNKAMYRLGLTPNYNYSSSYFEKQMSSFIRDLGINVIENDRNLISPYEIDIVIPEFKLAIEYCGLYWHNELHKDKHYHKNKMRLCNDVGYKLLTIFEDEWKNKQEIVKNIIRYHLNKNDSRIYARNCEIDTASTKHKKEFFNKTHIQGDGPSSINVGLYNEERLVACMSFMKKDMTLILNRFSTITTIPGGFSKLLSYVKKQYDFDQIETFADQRWSDGKLYDNNGFEKVKELKPDYYYVYKNQRLHKFNFRHKKLKKILGESYSSSLSEHDNCLNNNIFRLYDCGKLKYTLSKR